MPSSKWVEQLPPTSGVSDPQVRQFLDALANAWSLRNGNTGYTDEQRFITKGEFDDLAQKAFTGYISGAVGGVVGGPAGPRPPGNYERIATSIVNSTLYGLLSARIPEIRKPYELLSEIDQTISNALSGVSILRNKITRLTEESDTSLREVRVLNTVVGQYDSLIFDSAQTVAGRATKIEALKAKYGSIESAITNINTVSVTSTSAAARAISAITATLGYDVRVFFNRAPNGLIQYVDPNPPTVLDAMRQPRLNDQWICPDAFGGEPEYTRRRWNGSAWIKGIAADIPANAGIAQERDARVRQDDANARVIQSMWAAVTGLQANIEDGAVVVASGDQGVFAQQWNTLQAAVYESDGTTARVFQLRQDMFVGVLPDGQNPGWPGINNLQNLRGAWTVRLAANGVVGGFGMVMEEDGTAVDPNNPTRVRFDFGVRADRFWIADPSVPNDAFDIDKVPFAVVNGNTYINTAFIGEASIDTLRLAGNAVTLSSSNSGDSGPGSNISSYSICSLSLQTGSNPNAIPSRVIVVGVGNFLNNSGNGGELTVDINGNQAAISLAGGYSGCATTVYHFDGMQPNQTYTFTLNASTSNSYGGPGNGPPTGRFYGHMILMGAKR